MYSYVYNRSKLTSTTPCIHVYIPPTWSCFVLVAVVSSVVFGEKCPPTSESTQMDDFRGQRLQPRIISFILHSPPSCLHFSPSCTLLVPLFPFLSTQLDAHSNLVNRRLEESGWDAVAKNTQNTRHNIYRTISNTITYLTIGLGLIAWPHLHHYNQDHIVSQYDCLQFSSMKLRTVIMS